jgi:hypothetical protein
MRNGEPSVVKAPPSRAARLSRRSWWRLRLLRQLRRAPAQFSWGTIEIALGAAVVRVGPGSDVTTLTNVLRAVKAAK